MNDDLFSERDRQQMKKRGVHSDVAERQIHILRNPPAAIRLTRPCTVGSGIERLTNLTELAQIGESAAAAGRVLKFVPASGAASRMFRELIAAADDRSRRPSDSPHVRELFERLDEFPFGTEVRSRASIGVEPETEDEQRRVLRVLLHDLGYASRPKALIPFHRSSETVRTAFEEQLLEACKFATAGDGTCQVHFTVAADALEAFRKALAAISPHVRRSRECMLDVTFSVQHPATDTLAVDGEGRPFRLADGSLLFRPGGHGALLRNLAETGGDIVVVKNIDNIVPDAMQDEVVRWKKVLIGTLVQLQQECFELLGACDSQELDDGTADRAIRFAADRFGRCPASPLRSLDEKRAFIVEALDRPLRVCGVVPNEGEPGGAPFWVDNSGSECIQIVESSQVTFADEEQARIWSCSTHFNPVDIVCGLRDVRGRQFDLSRYVDDEAVFVSKKSHEGRDLLGLELPGLWNGAMAKWNTVCVEVPASTFAPVKTVFDLLRPQHQMHG